VSYDKLYDQLLARKESRESSTLTMVAIASSASLLLFIFYVGNLDKITPDLILSNIIQIIGIVFPLLGIFYREITFRSIQAHDNTILNAILLRDVPDVSQHDIIRDVVIKYERYRTIRQILLYSLLMIPVLAWIFLYDYFIGGIIDFIIILLIISLPIPLQRSTKEDRFPETELPDFLQ